MGYNFFVDGLGFNKAVSPDNPYQRATAPFRKDQIDSAAVPGDNSLTGWWVRSQFSFHEGDGIKYYDVEGSTDVLNRFQDASKVDPWTPGQVNLALGTYKTTTVPSGFIAFSSYSGHTYSVAGYGLYKDNVLQSAFGTGSAFDVTQHYGANSNTIVDIDAGTTLWTNSNTGGSGDSILRMFVAKGRLWAVASNGDWFNLPLTGGTIPAGGGSYLFWSSGWTYISGNAVGFAETPGPVYMAYGRYIYSVTPDSTGAVPSTGTPVVVADMGSGKNVQSLVYCRGYLGIVTDTAFHVAVINGDGSLTLGPELVRYGESDCRAAYAFGDRIYFTATDSVFGDSNRTMDLYEVNLAEGISPLEPSWQKRVTWIFSFADNGVSFCESSSQGFVVVSSASTTANFYATNPFAAVCESSGWITTGYHRLGTLDDKQFHEVQVSLDAATDDLSQKCLVFRVDLDGTQTLLGTVYNGKTVLSLGDVKAEAIALKFILYRGINYGSGYSPTLLGYQIRALPVPKRQRLIRVPVFMFDVEQDASGHRMGKAKDAWKRLKALEAYEEAHSIVTYKDDDTGETGTAYIESIETQVESTSSARASDRGFGGIVTITLRRIGD